MPEVLSQTQPASLEVTGVAWFAFVIPLLVGLLHCLLGYFVYRVSMVLWTMLLAGAAGALLVDAVKDAPSSLDYAVICTALAGLGALAGWFFHRVFLAVSAFLAVMGLVSVLMGTPPGTGTIILGIFLGLLAGAVTLIWTRHVVIGVYGLGGAWSVVLSCMMIFTAGRAEADLMAGWNWSRWTLLVGTVVLGAAGMALQYRLTGLIRSSLTPEGSAGRRRDKDGKRRIGRHNTVSASVRKSHKPCK